MLLHHAKVYYNLKVLFPNAKVYIGTSNKTEPGTSPFNFKEKQLIAQAQGINPDNVLEANSPYVHTFYTQFDHDNTIVIFAVGEKDSNRFPMTNVDKETGLDMTVRGEPRPKYYQMINTYNNDNPKPMSERGYIYNIENIVDSDNEVSSASAFREALLNSPSKEAAKEVFTKQFVDYREDVFDLVYRKIVGEKMSEDLNILRKLAGLGESGPVEFENNVEVKDVQFTPPSKSSSVHSIANRFPKGSDVNDKDTKREEFINALLKAPASLLSEINERISPADDNGLAAGEKLSAVINILEKEGSSIADLSDDDKKFTLDLVKKAINEMDLDAGDESEYEPEEDDFEKESLNLSDIRSDYGVEEALKTNSKGFLVYSNGNPLSFSDWSYENKKEGGDGSEEAYKTYLELVKEEDISEGGDCYHCKGDDPDCEHCDGDGYVKFDDDPQEPSQDEIDNNEAAYKKYIGKHKKDESVSEDRDGPTPSEMSDEELMDYVGQKEEDIVDDIQQHIAPDHLHKDNYDEMFMKYRTEVLEPAAHDLNMDYAMMNMDSDREDVDAEESIEDTSNKALEAAMEELKKLAGL